MSNRNPKLFSVKLLSNQSAHSLSCCMGLFFPRWRRTFVFSFAELNEIPGSPFPLLVNVPLNGSTTTWSIIHFIPFGITCKSALSFIIQVINEDVNQYWPPVLTLEYSTSVWHPGGLYASDQPSRPSCSGIFQSTLLFIYQLCTSLKFVNKDIIGDSVESLTKIKKNNIHCSSFTHQASLFIEENSKVCHRIIDFF